MGSSRSQPLLQGGACSTSTNSEVPEEANRYVFHHLIVQSIARYSGLCFYVSLLAVVYHCLYCLGHQTHVCRHSGGSRNLQRGVPIQDRWSVRTPKSREVRGDLLCDLIQSIAKTSFQASRVCK